MRDKIRTARLRIHDMLDAIDSARAAAAGLTADQFAAPSLNRLAAERAIEIISEASRHVPSELKQGEPDIPWQDIAGIGNILRHDYQDIAPRTISNTIEHDLTPLEEALRRILVSIEDR